MPKKPAKETDRKADKSEAKAERAEAPANPNPTADELDAIGAKWVKAEDAREN